MAKATVKSEAYIMNELRVIAREWKTSIYDTARMTLQDYYQGYEDMEFIIEKWSDEKVIAEYIKIKSDY